MAPAPMQDDHWPLLLRAVGRKVPLRRGMATTVYGDFEWDDAKAAANLKKHRVSFEEASTVFDDAAAIDAPDLLDPTRFVILGLSHHHGRVLFVVHAEHGARIRIISARRASAAQRKKYEEGT
jgi:uncharacterized DUF497 family protein